MTQHLQAFLGACARAVPLAGCLLEVPPIDGEPTTEDDATTREGNAAETGLRARELESLDGATAEVILPGEDVLAAVVGCGR